MEIVTNIEVVRYRIAHSRLKGELVTAHLNANA
jgi:hypothetical protein